MGVDGENADRNKRAMLKHFRNLVDETASKASFLAAFKRSDSSKAEALARAGSSFTGKDSSDLPMSSNAGSESDSDAASDMEDGSREPSGNVGQDEEGDCEMAETKGEGEGNGSCKFKFLILLSGLLAVGLESFCVRRHMNCGFFGWQHSL